MVFGLLEAHPDRMATEGGAVTAWSSVGDLSSVWRQADPVLRPSLTDGWVGMGGNSRTELAVGTNTAITIAARLFQSIMASISRLWRRQRRIAARGGEPLAF
ncbi:hypothetical protein [Paracoccus sp. (in: a-proteobacteria)]|uniref:hypothetical protein n=1 Tax=Paracoccus sp. TaxID=267 RepID=UPI0026E00A98|nr:hypothetical protein [Paracoccus sp. (in: a-proteobacteria)]MDO5648010.1 hypothetical protein [Paracoccus sp. (in: a-proteobacteria)]